MDRFQIIRPYLEDEITLSRLSKTTRFSLSTLKRWVTLYKNDGLSGLTRKARSDKDTRRHITPEMEQLVEAIVLKKPSLTLAAVHRKISDIARRMGIREPTYRVVWLIAQRIDPGLIKLAHEGSKAYDQKFELIIRREASASNEIWQADHTLLDILLIDEKGNARKPWLTTIIDDYSRAICGYYLSFDHPTAMNTALALRQAIWRKKDPSWYICGIPGILYSDNGSDFTSKHISQVAADLKIQLINSIPGKPQGRGRIERFFLTVNQLFLMNLPGYAPSGTINVKAELILSKFTHLLEQFVVHEYHQRSHSGIGKSPMERWIGKGFLPQMPQSLELLDLLLLTVVRPRKVRRDGIHFQNYIYMEPTLAAYVGETVNIRYDPRDLGEIRIYHQGLFLCRAICQELADQTISLKDIIGARQKRKRELRKRIEERKSLADVLFASLEPISDEGSKSVTNAVVDKPKKNKLKRYDHD